jgi:hypothetical protein
MLNPNIVPIDLVNENTNTVAIMVTAIPAMKTNFLPKRSQRFGEDDPDI